MKCNQICEWNSNVGCIRPYGVPCILGNVSLTERKTTNADRIRSMTDEELAELIVVRIKDIHHQGMRELAYSAWLEWLQKPAEQKKL